MVPTGVAQVSGGGGTSYDMPWRDKDEDFLDWARRAMYMPMPSTTQAINSKRAKVINPRVRI